MRSWIKCALWIFLLCGFPLPASAQDGRLAKAREEKKVVVYNTTTIPPDQRSGKPYIRGARMTLTDVLEYFAGGLTREGSLAGFPALIAEDIRDRLAFAADREPKFANLPGCN